MQHRPEATVQRIQALEMTADELIALLDLQPHPEGGYFKETFRDEVKAFLEDKHITVNWKSYTVRTFLNLPTFQCPVATMFKYTLYYSVKELDRF